MEKFKKFSFYSFYSFLICFLSCESQEKNAVLKYPNGVVAEKRAFVNKADLSSYEISNYYPSGQLHKKATVKNGQYISSKLSYYENGKIEQIDSLSEPCDTSISACDGILTRYYENGNISQRYVVRNHKLNGLSKHYLENGILAKEYYLKDDTIKDGKYSEFYDNGKVLYSCYYNNGIKTGYQYYFSEKGDTTRYNNHNSKGENDLPFKQWLTTGEILTGDYSSNKKLIVWIWHDQQGHELKKQIDDFKTKGIVIPK